MIMYGYMDGSTVAVLYEIEDGGFRYKMQVLLADMRPELATLLKVKARMVDSPISVYLDDEGNVIDTPESVK